jgi:hypothetical protein
VYNLYRTHKSQCKLMGAEKGRDFCVNPDCRAGFTTPRLAPIALHPYIGIIAEERSKINYIAHVSYSVIQEAQESM